MAKIASGPQLWRANQAGRLQITEEPVEPITHEEAWDLVATVARGGSAFEAVSIEGREAA
jgi:hypothetical protein